MTTKTKVRKLTKPTPDAKTEAPAKSATVTPLKAICSSLKLDPRTARRVLRAQGFDWHGPRARWDMTAKQIEKVTTVLKEHAAA